MARYTGPTSKKARAFGEAIYGFDKAFERKKYRPGQHGNSRRRRQNSDSRAGPRPDPGWTQAGPVRTAPDLARPVQNTLYSVKI